ncbi:hypothetical protein RI367_007850 [Sorochytrium milnesiophthora]
MKSHALSLGALLAVVALLLLSSPTAALAKVIKRLPANMPRGTAVAPHRYIVEFTAAPTKLVGVQSTLQSVTAQHDQFRAAAQSQGIPLQEHRAFTDLYNGLSVEVHSDADAERLAQLPNVAAVYPMVLYSQNPGYAFLKHDMAGHRDLLPQLLGASNMTNVNKVNVDLGLKGKGVKIGIIDTGIDWMHPAFAETGKTCTTWKGDGCRVKFGQDFAGDDYDSTTQPIPHPGPSPMDCAGHGTHVAGIAAGFDKVIQGVAPEAALGAYRVFGCNGTTGIDLMIAAMEQAYKDGMDAINMSIGGGTSFSEFPDAVVASRLGELGLMVQSALGNDGAKGMFQASSPGVAAHGFGVASFDNVVKLAPGFTVKTSDGSTIGPVSLSAPENGPAFPFDTPLPVVASSNDITVKDDGCAAYPAGHFKGVIALIRRGTCAFTVKSQNAQDAGAVAALIYNNQPGDLTPQIVGISIPVAIIDAVSGQTIVQAFAAGKAPAATFSAQLLEFAVPTGGQPSDFSSWGPGPDLAFKPDVATPGGFIYSSFPRKQGSYAVLSGTSMATPFFTGIVALWLEQNKGVSRADRHQDIVRAAAQNAGKPVEIAPGYAWPTAKQGPGLVDALQMVRPTAIVTPARLPLRDVFGANKRRTVPLSIRNHGHDAQTFTFSHFPAMSVTGINVTQGDLVPSFSTEVARVTFSQPSVTLAAGAKADVSVTINLENANLPDEQFWHLSGYVVVTGDKSANTTAVHVPYHALKGDYSKYPIVADPQGVGAPLLTDATIGITPPPANVPVYNDPKQTVTFTLNGTDAPVAVYNTVHPARLLTLTVNDAKSDKQLGYLDYEEFLQPYNAMLPSRVVGNATVLGWDTTVFTDATNTTNTVQLGDGAYYWKLSVIPASSGPAPKNPLAALKEVWRSPTIVIKAGLPNPSPPTPTPTPTATVPAPPKYHHPTPTPPPPPKYHRGP